MGARAEASVSGRVGRPSGRAGGKSEQLGRWETEQGEEHDRASARCNEAHSKEQTARCKESTNVQGFGRTRVSQQLRQGANPLGHWRGLGRGLLCSGRRGGALLPGRRCRLAVKRPLHHLQPLRRLLQGEAHAASCSRHLLSHERWWQ